MFNLGVGEIVVLGLLGVIVLGPTKLSELAARIDPGPWSWSDWLLACAALVSATVALGFLTGVRP